MNSIFGLLGDISEAEVMLMGKRLNHRGQCQKIVRVSEGLIFGFGSTQPDEHIFHGDKSFIVSDSSIYNRRELFDYLAAKKIYPISQTNEELMLLLFGQEGIRDIERINGDFAFAIWDHSAGRLILGRDLVGCRPLYYSRLPKGAFAFATEYKAILSLLDCRPKVDLDMVQHLQHYKKLPVGKTLLCDISAVKAGTVEVFNDNGDFIERQQMSPIKSEVSINTEIEAAAHLRDKLIEAVKCRVDDPKKIGIALSGGIDSIGIAFICRKLFQNAEIHTFTAGYGNDNSELITAEKVALLINATHHHVDTPPELIRYDLPKLVWHLEDPYSRSESLQLLKIGEAAKQHVDAIICGMEADALFAGMPRHKLFWLMRKYPMFKKYLGEIYDFTQSGLKPISLLGKCLKKAYFRNSIPGVTKIKGADYAPHHTRFPPITKDYVNLNLAAGFQKGACQDGQKLERTFAASGVQYRTPFIDRNLIKAALSVSDALKFKNRTNKYILRKALEPIVPPEFLNVPKIPQSMKYDHQFSAAIDDVIEKYLNQSSVNERDFFYYSDIQKLKRENPSDPYSAEWAMRIWTAILTELWAMEFIDRYNKGIMNNEDGRYH